MNSVLTHQEQSLLDQALEAASDTKSLTVGGGVRHEAARHFAAAFRDASAMIVADERTYNAAGADVRESFRKAGISCGEPFLFPPEVYAESAFVDQLEEATRSTDAILAAVGSGTINDLTKLVSGRREKPYMVVASAASMDGYTAYGASITDRGSKQTFSCPAPRAVLADLDVIAEAPRGMNASGYADLFAKGVAGADWILADALGEEPIDPAVWRTVQEFLPDWINDPGGVRQSDPDCLKKLVVGLMMSGFAMQAARTSRPASGAEHQFSHLWDMQHHKHEGKAPSHGFKVGIGTLASLALYDVLLRKGSEVFEVETALANWPSLSEVDGRIRELLGEGELGDKGLEETHHKYISGDALRKQLEQLREQWPEIKRRLEDHLRPFRNAVALLGDADCPVAPEQIGISRDRLRRSYEQAYYIRRRFTVLDVAMRAGIFAESVDQATPFGNGLALGREPS